MMFLDQSSIDVAKQLAGNIVSDSYKQSPMARECSLVSELPRSSVCLKLSKNKWAVSRLPSREGSVNGYLLCCQFLKGETSKKAMCMKSKGRGSIGPDLSLFGFFLGSAACS